MKAYLFGVASVVYVLISVHVANVLYEADQRIGRASSVTNYVYGAVWPLDILLIGTMGAMGAGVGVYDSAYHYEEPKP